MIERGDALVAHQLAILFVDLKDAQTNVELMLSLGIKLYVSHPHAPASDAEAAWLMESLVRIAEAKRDIDLEQCRLRHERKRQAGRLLARPPFGFKAAGPRGRRRLVPDRNEQLIIARILQWRAEGHTWTAIARHLRRLKIHNRSGNPWW
jgi:DNA invertase Pin-like site-specific DNA recombinase